VAVTLAIVLLFASLIVLVYFVHHIAHSIQVDEIMSGVEQTTLRVIEHDLPTTGVTDVPVPDPPVWAVAMPAYTSGYVQALNPAGLLEIAIDNHLVCAVAPMVGEHVIEGEPLAWLWRASPEEPPPDPASFAGVLHDAVRIGYERTAEQDVAFGIRQLADIGVKALSPAINDPYTAMQALEHIADVLASLASRPLGAQFLYDARGALRVVVPARDFAYYVELGTGQIRRYGCAEPRVLNALLKVLGTLGQFCRDDDARAVLAHSAGLVAEAADAIVQEGDRRPVTERARAVLSKLSG
jgi:uncharacterized membrane protein